MKLLRIVLLFQLPLTLGGLLHAEDMGDMPGMSGQGESHSQAAKLTPQQIQFLARYEAVRAALAADNLDAAKQAAAALGDIPAARHLVEADSLAMARMAFKKLSGRAIQIAKGQDGYYVVHCPMAGADWVQNTSRVENPYLGKQQSACGVIEK